MEIATNNKVLRVKRNTKKHYQLLVILSVPLAWLLLFKYGPMYGLLMAFVDFDMQAGIFGSKWVGFDNFIKFLNNYMFVKVLVNTITISGYYIIASFPFPIILAILINSTKKRKFAKVVQTVTYMPYFISTVVIAGIILQLLNPKVGLISYLIQFLGGTPKDFMADPKFFPHVYVWSGVWQNCGWGTIVYLAALSGVNLSHHEAAMIDGASRLQRVRHIDFPCILPTASIMLILNAGTLMSVGFEKIFVLQNALNKDASEVLSTFVYSIGLSSQVPDIPMATAIGFFNGIINLILVLIVNNISKKISNNGLL